MRKVGAKHVGSCASHSFVTYSLGSVVVTDTLAVKDEADAVFGLAHPLCVRLLELGELGGALDLEEDLVSIGIFDLDVELLTALGLGLRIV